MFYIIKSIDQKINCIFCDSQSFEVYSQIGTYWMQCCKCKHRGPVNYKSLTDANKDIIKSLVTEYIEVYGCVEKNA